MDEQLKNLIEGAKKQGAKDNDIKKIIDMYIADQKKKGESEPTEKEKPLASPTQTTQQPTSLDTEQPTRAQVAVSLGGPTKLFQQQPVQPNESIMSAQPDVLVPSKPIEQKQKKYYRQVADERKDVQNTIVALENRHLKAGRNIEELRNEGTYQYLQQKKDQLDKEFKPAEVAIREVQKNAAFGNGMLERLVSSSTDGKYSYLSTDVINLDKEVEDNLIDKFDNAPEETKQKWYKGALPLEKKEELINAAKTDVLNSNYKKIKEDNAYFLTNIKDNPNVSREDKLSAYNKLKSQNDAFNAKVATEFAGNLLKNNFKATDSSNNLDEAIFKKYEGFIPDTVDAVSSFLEGMGQVTAKAATGIPELILMGGERFNQAIGVSKPEDYTPIEATLDMINETTNYNFLPSSKSAEGNIVDKEGNLNISYKAITKTLANTLPFTLKIMNDVKKGRIEGNPQSMVSQLLNPKNSREFADKLRVAETAYKVTIGDNYREAKDLGMDDSKAFTYANVMSMAEGVSENIIPDFKYFDSLTGATIKSAFKGSLKSAATKQAVKNVTKDFFKNIALELGEEEFSLAVEDGLKYSLLLNHKNSEFWNLKRQNELVASTVIMSGSMGAVYSRGKFKENKTDIYREVYKNIDGLQQSFNDEINSPLNDEKTKQTFRNAYKFASDVSNAIAKAPENVTADQVDLLVQKNKLEEKKKTIDAAFHPDINEEIAGIDTKIRELAKAPAVEVVAPKVIAEEKVKTETAAEEAKPIISGQRVSDVLNRPATLESFGGAKLDAPVEGNIYQEGQRVIFEDKNNKTYDLGNVDEISDTKVEELGIQPQTELMSVTPEGKIKVGDNTWSIQTELPNNGVEYDADGNVKAVSLKDDSGKTVMYEGQIAEDIAYQTLLNQTQTEEQRQAINEILENDEELNRQLREAEEAAAETTGEVVEPGVTETEVTATEEIAPSDIETTLDEVITPASSNIKEQIARAKKAISKFLPNVEIVYHTTAESFQSVVGDNSRGYYDTGTKKIHINGSNATNNTVAHEVFHAVILKYITSDKQATDLTNRMFKALAKSIKNNPKLLKDITKFAESYSKGLQSEEKLAEVLGYLASEYETLPDVSKNIIQKWIENIAKMVGIKKFTDQEVVDFMNTLATRVSTGQEITEGDVGNILKKIDNNELFENEYVPTNGTVENTKSGRKSVFIDTVVKESDIIDPKTLIGKPLEVVYYDNFTSSPYKLKNRVSGSEIDRTGEGGPGYSYRNEIRKNKIVAAFTNVTKGLNLIQGIRSRNEVAKENAVVGVALQNKETGHLGNKTTERDFYSPTEGVIAQAINDKLITEDQAVQMLKGAVDAYGQTKKGSDSKSSLGFTSNDFSTLDEFYKKINSISFERRGTFNAMAIPSKSDLKITKSTKPYVKTWLDSGIPTLNEYYDATSEKYTKEAEPHDIVKYFDPNLNKLGIDSTVNVTEAEIKRAKSMGIEIETIDNNLSHTSYPVVLFGNNIGIPSTFHSVRDMSKDWNVTNPFFKAGRRSDKAVPVRIQEIKEVKRTPKVSGRKQKLAPNGKPSNLDNNQWEQVRTTEFKNWFGDWENDPENSSKVVDENGEPLVVFHGTNANFDEFKNKVGIRGGQFTGAREVISDTYFFTDDIEYAEKAAKVRVENFNGKKNIISSFLNIRKPLDFTTFDYKTEELFKEFTGLWPHEYFGYNDNFDQWWRLFDKDEDDITEQVKSKGYNGVMLAEESKSIKNDKGYTIEVASIKSFGVFNPNQIKSATENTGEFSTENISIRRQKQISPENSSNYANMTEDGKGNFVFYHFGPRGIKAIDPKRYGSNKGAITSKPEVAAMGRVGGMSQFYTMPEYQESNVSGDKYMIKVPMDKVYDFNTDPENLYEKAREMFKAKHPDLPFTANDQLAYITKLAEKAGYDMTVAEWNDMSRAQSTKALKPMDTQVMDGNVISKPFKEDYESNSAKGFEPVIPTSKEAKLKDVYQKINAERNAKNRYDSLYSLAEDFPKLSQDKITDMIENSDISQEMKDAYAEALAYEPGKRMSGRRQVNTDDIKENTKTEIDNLKKLPKDTDGGATFNLDGKKYEGGGLVVPVVSVNTTQGKISPEMVADFAKTNEDKIGDSDVVKLGIYKFENSDGASIDLNIVVPTEHRDVAVEFGRLAGQESLFDLDTFENVKTGADGLNPMTFTPAEFKEIAASLKNGVMPSAVSGRRQKTVSPIDTAVEAAKKQGFDDKQIIEYLMTKGYTRAQATNAVIRYDNVKAVKLRKADQVFTKEGRNKLVTFFDSLRRRSLSAKSFLPKSLFLFKEKIEANIEAEAKRATYLVKEFNKMVDNYKGDVKSLVTEFDKYLRGDQTAIIPDEFKAVAGKMRMHIDNLSNMLIETGAVTPTQAETIRKNMGEYINRSYQVFDKKNWKKQVTEEMKNAARLDIANRLRPIAEKESEKTGKDVDILLNKLIDEQINELIEGTSAASFLGVGKTGSKDTSIMKEKTDIPPSIRVLMGEYTDPTQNYSRTIFKLASYAENARFLQSAKEAGMGVFFFPSRNGEFDTKIAGDASKTMNPLNGLYTTKEIADALSTPPGLDALLETKFGTPVKTAYETYMKFVSTVKWLKTIASIGTHAKNIFGNVWFMLSNGYINPKQYANSFAVIKNSSREDLRDKLDEYIRAGIVNQSATLGEIRAMFNDANFEDTLDKRLKTKPIAGFINKLKKLSGKLSVAYQAEDDFFKIISYETEKARYSKAFYSESFDNLNDDQKTVVKDYAAEITKNVLPNYGRVPNLVKFLRVVPVTGTFISFQAEAYRTAWNSVALSIDEMKSDNKKVKAIGAKRLIGIAAAQGLKFGLMTLLGKAISGGDDDDDELSKYTKMFVAPWSTDSDIVLVSHGDGKMSYIDFSASDPHGGIKKAYNAAMSGDDFGQAFGKGMGVVLEPFLKEDIFKELIGDITENKNSYGNTLYNEKDSNVNKVNAIMARIYKTFEPGSFSTVRKIYESEDKGNEILGQMSGYKVNTVDINKQLGFKMQKLKAEENEARKIYNSAFRKYEAGEITEDEYNAAYNQANDATKEVYSRMYDNIKASSFFGVSDEGLTKTMDDARLSDSLINSLFYGEYPDIKEKASE